MKQLITIASIIIALLFLIISIKETPKMPEFNSYIELPNEVINLKGIK